MSAAKHKKQKRIRFELSIWGVIGIGVVCFCIFLWLFLLGIWVGQTILVSSAGPAASAQSGFTAVAPLLKTGSYPEIGLS